MQISSGVSQPKGIFVAMARARMLRIGIIYETFETYARRSGEPDDAHAEYEPESTIEALEGAIAGLGHRPVRLGSPHHLLETLKRGALGVDAALTIAEGFGSRNREAWAPVLLELAGVPTLGSDALTLSLSLDKAWTGALLRDAGVRVPAQCTLRSQREAEDAELPAEFPLFVKPRWEGTAKGIRRSSRVEDRTALAREVARVVRDYAQPALVEAFVPGPEYTVTLVGNDPPRALPVVQRALEVETRIGLHALGGADEGPLEYCTPGELGPELEATLCRLGLRVYALLECRDFARADFRLDASGEPVFLEINPLPTFAPDGTFGILAELAGRPLTALLGDVLAEGLQRLGLPARASEQQSA
jgi:D-alanine-D-alanine ligase